MATRRQPCAPRRATSWRASSLGAILIIACFGAAEEPKPLGLRGTVTWYENNGLWSGIRVPIGTPKQIVDLQVSTSSGDTWVMKEDICPEPVLPVCVNRGGAFYPGRSSTWKQTEVSKVLDYRKDLNDGTELTGTMGQDTILLGQNEVELTNWPLAVLDRASVFMGSLGIGIKEDESLSQALKEKGAIPSNSWSYTAGAGYRTKRVQSLLVFGGYQANRFSANHHNTFPLDRKNQPRGFLTSLSLRALGQPTWGSPLSVIVEPISVLIDSSTPYIWLPEKACREIEDALRLRYDASRNLYFWGSEQNYELNRGTDPFLQFRISGTREELDYAELNVTIRALSLDMNRPQNETDLQDEPGSAGKVKYVALRRSFSEDQHVLGLSFLQETYLIVHNEAREWTIYPANFDFELTGKYELSAMAPEGIAIRSKPQDSGLSGPAKIGIGVALGVVALCIALAFTAWWRRRRKQSKERSTHELQDYNRIAGSNTSTPVQNFVKPADTVSVEPAALSPQWSPHTARQSTTTVETAPIVSPMSPVQQQEQLMQEPVELPGDMVQMEPQEMEGSQFVGQPAGGRRRAAEKVLLTDEAMRARRARGGGGPSGN